MQAYIDDSMNEGEVLVFGGLIASPRRWKAFSAAWQECLNDAPWDNFKMSKVWYRCKGKKLEYATRHYRTMCEHVQGGLCFVIPIAPFEEAAALYGLSGTKFADPYFWASKGVISGLAQSQKAWGLTEAVDFVFDERPEEEKAIIRDAWNIYLATVPDEVRSVTGKRPEFADDEQELPLQAADMWVWWCRKTWRENGGTIPELSYPIPWGSYGDLPQLIMQWTAEDINYELSRAAEMMRDFSGFLEQHPNILKVLKLDSRMDNV